MFSTQLLSALFAASLACAASIEARDPAHEIEARQSSSLPNGWKMTSSCAEDDGKQRVFSPSGAHALQRNVFTEDNSPKKCLSTCAGEGYGYAALRYGTECWCGSSKPKITSRPKSQCDRPCSGDMKQMCGGHVASTVYTNSKLAGKKPKPSSSPAKLSRGWSVAYKCVNDPELGETLLQSTKVFELQNNTPETCTALCASNGYYIAGVEYSNECMCGKGFRKDAHPEKLQRPSSECNMACTGDGSLTCGAGHRVQLYKHKKLTGTMYEMKV